MSLHKWVMEFQGMARKHFLRKCSYVVRFCFIRSLKHKGIEHHKSHQPTNKNPFPQQSKNEFQESSCKKIVN